MRWRSTSSGAVGSERLAYYDAIAPIVSADSIDWDRGVSGLALGQGRGRGRSHGVRELPARRGRLPRVRARARRGAQGRAEAVRGGALLRGLPADRGDGRARRDDARVRADEAGRACRSEDRARPFAVVQLRKEDEAGTAYNLVGFQTRMTWGEQARLQDHPRARERGVFPLRRGAPEHVPERAAAARRHLAASRAIRGSTSPARSRASRATSRARLEAGSSRGSSPSA